MPNSEIGIKGFKWPSESISFKSKTYPKLNPYTNTYLQKLLLAMPNKMCHDCCDRSMLCTKVASKRPNSWRTSSADAECSWWAQSVYWEVWLLRQWEAFIMAISQWELPRTVFVTRFRKLDGWWGLHNCGPTVDITQFQKSELKFVL